MIGETALPAPHVLGSPELAAGRFAVSLAGYPLGRAGSEHSVALGILGQAPATVALLLDLDVAVVLAARASSLGARVLVASDDPGWQTLVRATSGTRRPAVVCDLQTAASHSGSFETPLVTISPMAAWDAGTLRQRQPWVTRFVLMPRADLRSMAVARSADVVLFGSQPSLDLGLVRSSLRLPPEAVEGLAGLRWSQVVVVTGGTYAHVDLELSPAELRLQASMAGWRRRGGRTRGRLGRRVLPPATGERPLPPPATGEEQPPGPVTSRAGRSRRRP